MLRLFRQEAIEHQRRRLHGEVIVAAPVPLRVLAAVSVMIVAVAMTYLALGTYARTETVSGFIAPRDGFVRIQAARGGVITRVSIHDGDLVEKDQTLFSLSLETATQEGPLAARVRDEAGRRLNQIDAQIQAASARYDAESARLAARMAATGGEITALKARAKSASELLILQRDDVAKYQELADRGVGSKIELSRRRQVVLTQRGNIQDLERQILARLGDLADLNHQAATLPGERDERLAQLGAQRADALQAIAQADAAKSYDLVAPIAGRISALQAHVGANVPVNAQLATIVPDRAELEAQLLVPARSAGFVALGQLVRLRIDAFPFQRFGFITAHITRLASVSIKPGDLLAPIDIREPVFIVGLALDDDQVTAYGQSHVLTPGMSLSGDIEMERRTFLDVVLDPLRAARGRV